MISIVTASEKERAQALNRRLALRVVVDICLGLSGRITGPLKLSGKARHRG